MKIGILGCGQAGSRIALALAAIAPDVELIVGEPVQRSSVFDPKSPFHVRFAKRFTDDAEFFNQEFDALVVSPDPISLFDRVGVLFKQDKMPFIAALNKLTPVLVERPLGFQGGDGELFAEFTKLENSRVMAYQFRLPFAKFLDAYQPTRILIDASLNCGLTNKLWRQDHEKITLPVHFGDQFLSLIDRAADDLRAEASSYQVASENGIDYDTGWDIRLTSKKIPMITVHLDQYTGANEYRFQHDIVRAFGQGFSASISTAHYEVRLADGTTDSYRYDLSTVSPENRSGVERLLAFLTEVEGYPAVPETEGLCRAIYESVLDWHNAMCGQPVLCARSLEAMSVELASRSLHLSSEVIARASGGRQ